MSQGQSFPLYCQNASYFHMACTRTGGIRNAHKILVKKICPERQFGTPDSTLQNNIKMYLEEEMGKIVLDLVGTEYSTITSAAYNTIKNVNRTAKDNLQINPITEHTWLDYYQKLWTKQFKDNTKEGKREKLTENCVDLITMEELETTVKALKSRKSSGSGGINNELYKHAPKIFYTKFRIF